MLMMVGFISHATLQMHSTACLKCKKLWPSTKLYIFNFNLLIQTQLRVNQPKIQFIWLSTWWVRAKIDTLDREIIVVTFPGWDPQHVIWDLEFWMKIYLLMVDHVNSLCRSYIYQLHQIWVIRRNLFHDATATIVHSFQVLCLNFFSAMLAGLPKIRIRQLQSILNYTAQVVANL